MVCRLKISTFVNFDFLVWNILFSRVSTIYSVLYVYVYVLYYYKIHTSHHFILKQNHLEKIKAFDIYQPIKIDATWNFSHFLFSETFVTIMRTTHTNTQNCIRGACVREQYIIVSLPLKNRRRTI